MSKEFLTCCRLGKEWLQRISDIVTEEKACVVFLVRRVLPFDIAWRRFKTFQYVSNAMCLIPSIWHH